MLQKCFLLVFGSVADLIVCAHSQNWNGKGERILCRHPHVETKRALVIPARVEPLLKLVFDGKLTEQMPSLDELRRLCLEGQTAVGAFQSKNRPLLPTISGCSRMLALG